MIFGKHDFDTKFCSKCGCDSFVVDTRYKSGVIFRRRECSRCGMRWNTKEYYARSERRRKNAY
jgi:transcriptional regulator NrdR family protein